MKLLEEEEEEDNENENEKEEEEDGDKKPEAPQPPEDAKPVGDPVRVSGKGRGRKRHYDSFEFDGNQYTLVSFPILHDFMIQTPIQQLIPVMVVLFLQEDPVLLVPEDKQQKPYVAIIKVFIYSLRYS